MKSVATARSFLAGALASALVVATSLAVAEEPASRFSLEEAIAFAVDHHPRIRTSRANEEVAAGRIDEARTASLLSAGISAELNRSTGNSIPGAFFPAQGFAPIAGPLRGRTLDGGTWQSGVSLWGSWDVTSVVRQAAAIDVALAGRRESEAATSARKLEIAYAVADAHLALVAAREVVRAAQANVDRARVFATIVKPLVDQNLRPGAELARADAEVALATTQLVRAEQGVAVRRAQLAEALGAPDRLVEIDIGGLLDPIEDRRAAGSRDLLQSPRVVEADAAVRRTQENVRAVHLEYLPRVELVASVWLRGSGYSSNVGLGAGEGLLPDVPNWAAGAVLTWPLFDIPRIRARTAVATAQVGVSASRKDELMLAVVSELRTASAMFDGASRIAKNTPTALASARSVEAQARARYQAGLTSVVDVAEAQRILAQAELDDMLARLEVRRAVLLFARATGDLGPFLSMTKRNP